VYARAFVLGVDFDCGGDGRVIRLIWVEMG